MAQQFDLVVLGTGTAARGVAMRVRAAGWTVAVVDSFIEGPCFDDGGSLLVVDIPFGRILRVTAAGEWSLVLSYDGEPNGPARHPDGRFIVADYRNGLMALDVAAGTVTPLLPRRNAESFKGLNDVIVGQSGAIYFTDQGQTGLHDPSGRVFRLRPDGALGCLLSNGPSPNGLALDHDETVLFVAMTRDNAVWRLPLAKDGTVNKVGRFCSFFGTSGPDGLAIDADGRLYVAHASLGHVFVIARNGECLALIRSCAGPTCTNVALDPANGRVLVTESSTGAVLEADMAA